MYMEYRKYETIDQHFLKSEHKSHCFSIVHSGRHKNFFILPGKELLDTE
jgi:hypothetical protein